MEQEFKWKLHCVSLGFALDYTPMKTCSLRETEMPEPAQWAAMFDFIPIFEDPAICPDHAIPLEEDGFPEEAFTKLVTRFMDACYKNGMVVKFNWERWEEEGTALVTDSSRFQAADLPTLRRLLTWHVRQNRFAKDHLASTIANGHILAILKRMKSLL